MRALSVLVLLLSLFAVSFAQEDDGDDGEQAARLFVYKSTSTSPIVEGKEFTITYQIFNNGDAAATSIDVADRYDPNSFELKDNVNADGSVLFSVDELAAGSQITRNVTVQPKLFGIYESTRARVRYTTGLHIEDVEDDVRTGFSTSLGRVRILSKEESLRVTSYFVKEWLVVAVLTAVAVLVPYNKWSSARAAYALEQSQTNNNKKKTK